LKRTTGASHARAARAKAMSMPSARSSSSKAAVDVGRPPESREETPRRASDALRREWGEVMNVHSRLEANRRLRPAGEAQNETA
jgi:hypothetical protein